MRGLVYVTLLLGLIACGGSNESAFSDEQLELALTEVSAERTQDAGVTLPSPSPSATTPITLTPSRQATSGPEPEAPHEDGIYIVGAEIAAGVWRSTSEAQNFCYWARRKYDGILLASYYGLPGVDLRVYPSDYEVELDGCGIWVYMGRN